jgi:hypothetical protein
MTKELITKRFKSLLEVSRGYLSFLRAENSEESRSIARAFMFDSLLKSLILISDEVLFQFEKAMKDQVARATYKQEVSHLKVSTLIVVRYELFEGLSEAFARVD